MLSSEFHHTPHTQPFPSSIFPFSWVGGLIYFEVVALGLENWGLKLLVSLGDWYRGIKVLGMGNKRGNFDLGCG